MNYLFQLDTNLFFLINHLPHNLFLDDFFGLLTFIGEAGAIWFILSFLLFLRSLRNLASKGHPLRSYEAKKLAVIWAIGVFTLFLALILKKIFGRERPEFVLQNVILPFGPDSSFSFPSGHALTSFTFAALLIGLEKLERLGKFGIVALAVLISFSRIYLGYHYPLDIVAGAIIGVIVAKIALRVLAIRRSL